MSNGAVNGSTTTDEPTETAVVTPEGHRYVVAGVFRGWIKRANTQEATGELHLTLGIHPKDKYEAFALTDLSGMTLHFQCWRPDFGGSDDEAASYVDMTGGDDGD